MRKAMLATAAATLMALSTSATPASVAQGHRAARTASVSVFHGVPNTPVDVYLNGKRILDDFQPGTLAGPLKVKAGFSRLAITAASATNDDDPIIGPVRQEFRRQRNYTVAAHLTAAGAPTVTTYWNPRSAPASGKGRLIVRHVAAAPAVDVYADGALTMRNLTNPRQSLLEVPARRYSVAVNLAGTPTTVIGPADVITKRHTNTIVYAWGSASDDNLALKVQRTRTK